MTLKMLKACFLQLYPIVNNKIVRFFAILVILKARFLQSFPRVNNKIIFENRFFLWHSWCAKHVSCYHILHSFLVKNKQQVHFFTDILLHMLSQSHLFLSYHLRLACYKKRNIIRHYTDNTRQYTDNTRQYTDNTTVWAQSNSYTKGVWKIDKRENNFTNNSSCIRQYKTSIVHLTYHVYPIWTT